MTFPVPFCISNSLIGQLRSNDNAIKLTHAQLVVGVFEHPPEFFFAITRKRRRYVPLFGQLFCNFPENFRSRSPKVRSPGQVK